MMPALLFAGGLAMPTPPMMPTTSATASAPRKLTRLSPPTRPEPKNLRSTRTYAKDATSSNAASADSSTSDASQPATKKPRETFSPWLASPQSPSGYDDCPRALGHPALRPLPAPVRSRPDTSSHRRRRWSDSGGQLFVLAQ